MKRILFSIIALMSGVGMIAAGNGTADSPYSVDEIIGAGIPESPVADVYVTGYIVGWVDGGNKWGTDNVYSVPAAIATNLILADSPAETDPGYCIPVQLPSGTVRNALNLVDNPKNLGHEVTLKGSWEKYFGTNGLKSVTEYEWIGDAPVHETVTFGPEVTGTRENPLSVSGLMAASELSNSIPNTYLKGVIVGYVPGMVREEAVFGAYGDAASTNILVADDAGCSDPFNCVAVQLPVGDVRNSLNLNEHPENLGKAVTLLGTNTKYFGSYGLKEVSDFAFDTVDDDDIVVSEVALYAGLENNADDWTFVNVSLDDALSYVWNWNGDGYDYLKGSAYYGGTYAAEAYAISPVIDLANVLNPSVQFEHAARYQTNLLTDCKLCVREAGASDWTELNIPVWPVAGNWTFVNSGEISLKDYAGKKIELAFKYVSTDTAADTWEIKNLYVKGNRIIEDKGTADKPLTVTELLEAGIPSAPVGDVYVTGYIVGWVNGYTYDTDCVFSVPASIPSNIILADSPSEKEHDYCIPVQILPGDVRNALNLMDNPENLGHQVTLKGSWEKYFGVTGLKYVTEYEWIGDAPVHEDVTFGPEVTGTRENPLSVPELMAASELGVSIPNTYLKGVIVGYVPGIDRAEAVFGAGADASTTNILVAENAGCIDPVECVYVQLPEGDVRDSLNLREHPENLGKTVTLLGINTKYYNSYGLQEVSEFVFDTVDPSVPVYPYSGLETNADDWTFVNVSLSDALSYVWSWNDYGYLSGSAYVGAPNAAEAYAISPVIDLADLANPCVEFEHAARYQTNLRKDCKLCVREAGASDWTELTITTWPEAGNWTFVKTVESLKAFKGKKIELAFKYVSTVTEADTWEIKNLYVCDKADPENPEPDPTPDPDNVVISIMVNNGCSLELITEPIDKEMTLSIVPDDYWSIARYSAEGQVVDLSAGMARFSLAESLNLNVTLEYDGFLKFIDGTTVKVEFDNAVTVARTAEGVVVKGLAAGDEVVIYNMAGQIIGTQKASAVEMNIELQPAMQYIIRIGNNAVKVIL